MAQRNQTIVCCPCHGANEKGEHPPVEGRLYEVPVDDEPPQMAGLQRQMDVADATRVLLQSGIEENEAARAVSHLNAAYPEERWVGAESWRPNLPMRVDAPTDDFWIARVYDDDGNATDVAEIDWDEIPIYRAQATHRHVGEADEARRRHHMVPLEA